MGKILKFCSSCEEGFAEKFSFCPNCANELTAFEMKPVEDSAVSAEPEEAAEAVKEPVIEAKPESVETEQPVAETSEADEIETVYETGPLETETIFEPLAFEPDESEALANDDVTEIEVEEPTDESDDYIAAAPIVAGETFASSESESVFSEDIESEALEQDTFGESAEQDYSYSIAADALTDDDYGITVIDESSSKMRSSLLLGASVLVLSVAIGGLGYSLFSHPLFIAAIDGDFSLLAPVDVGPIDIEEEPPKKKANDKDSGGGGGGGNERKTPPSKGELPSQTREKIPPPMPVERMTNPDLKINNQTVGDIKRPRNDRSGLPNGVSGKISSGSGTGGGFGTGRGTGYGGGTGLGEGNGNGSGSGNGNGNGNGDGTGNGTRKPPPARTSGPTVGIKILSKPQATYTDAARQQNVQGTVMLRVTFLASGSIGSISPVKSLPHGLTARAIAAARRIRFTPKMVNGVKRSVTKRIQYRFTIY